MPSMEPSSLTDRVGSAIELASNWLHSTRVDAEGRIVHLNVRSEGTTDNQVITSQYTILNFPLKNAWKQFQRPANVYFLIILLLQTWKKVSITNGQPAILLPLLFVLFVSATKDAVEDFRRHQADSTENNRIVLVLNPITKEWEEKPWHVLHQGDVIKLKNREHIPADLVLLDSADANQLVYVMTAGLDGETNLKLREVALDMPKTIYKEKGHSVMCDKPNKSIETFNGVFHIIDEATNGKDEIALGPKNIILRGCQVRNTDWVIGCVIYTGHETKIQMNAASPAYKTSSYMTIANNEMKRVFALQCLCCIVAAIYSTVMLDHTGSHQYLEPEFATDFEEAALRFFNYVIIFTNFIPISLLVTIDMVKAAQAYFIQVDKEMYYKPLDKSAKVLTSELNEELGAIDHVFSDKTGTLTANVMEFRKCSVNGVSYGLGTTEVGKGVLQRQGKPIPEDVKMEEDVPNVNFVDPKLFEDLKNTESEQSGKLAALFTALALNHGVMPEHIEGEGEESVLYSASSPDEGALVSAAKYFGFKFWKREPKLLTCKIAGENRTFEILHNLEFTSARKRSSVIVRMHDGSVVLHTKGADSVIYERLGRGVSKEEQAKSLEILEATRGHVEEFAADGLRTLCVARRVIPSDIYADWCKRYVEASKLMVDRDAQVAKLADEIESNLELVGATAIEDNLQEGVPDAIRALRAAGVKVWMLTGDKVDTAVNIGFSCALWQEDMKLIYLVAGEGHMECNESDGLPNEEVLRRKVTGVVMECMVNNDAGESKKQICMVVDTGALAGILHYNLVEEFLSATETCKSVICARVSPDQKGEVVAAVRARNPHLRTLAIGDGANDVPMIQRAHVGVGIHGEEGLQAVNASDYAIGQFRFLKRLMLVHGRWSARRVGTVIAYMFYKNAVLVLPQFIFAFLCLASGQNFYLEYPVYQGYNLLFTSLPIIAFGVLDQDLSAETCLQVPQVYSEGNVRLGHFFNPKLFWRWMLEGLVQAGVITMVCLYSLQAHGGVVSNDGLVSGIWYVGTIIGFCDVAVVNLRLALENKYWSMLWVLSLVISIGVFIASVVLFSNAGWLASMFSSFLGVGIGRTMEDLTSWLTVLAASALGLLPSVTFIAYLSLYGSAPSYHCRLAKRMKKD